MNCQECGAPVPEGRKKFCRQKCASRARNKKYNYAYKKETGDQSIDFFGFLTRKGLA